MRSARKSRRLVPTLVGTVATVAAPLSVSAPAWAASSVTTVLAAAPVTTSAAAQRDSHSAGSPPHARPYPWSTATAMARYDGPPAARRSSRSS